MRKQAPDSRSFRVSDSVSSKDAMTSYLLASLVMTRLHHQCTILSRRSWDSSLLGLADGFHHPVDAHLIIRDGLWTRLAGGRAFLEPLLHSLGNCVDIC